MESFWNGKSPNAPVSLTVVENCKGGPTILGITNYLWRFMNNWTSRVTGKEFFGENPVRLGILGLLTSRVEFAPTSIGFGGHR